MDLSFTPDQDALREADDPPLRQGIARRAGAGGRGRRASIRPSGTAVVAMGLPTMALPEARRRRRGVAHRPGRRRRGPRRPPRARSRSWRPPWRLACWLAVGGAEPPGRDRGGSAAPRWPCDPASAGAAPLVPGRRRRRDRGGPRRRPDPRRRRYPARRPGARSPAWPSPTSTWPAPRCSPRGPMPSAAYERGPRRVAGAHRRGPGRAGPGHARRRRAVRQGPPPVRRADRQLPDPAAPLRRPARPGRRQPPARLRGRVGARRGRAHALVPSPPRRRGGAARWPTRRPGSASTSTAATASCSSTTCSCTSAGPRPPACCSAIPATSCSGSPSTDGAPHAPDPAAVVAAATDRPTRAGMDFRFEPETEAFRAEVRGVHRRAPRRRDRRPSPSPPARCTTGASTGRCASGATWPPAGRPRSAGWAAAPSTSACSRRSSTAPARPSTA